MDISSIALTNLSNSSPDLPVAYVDSVETGCVVAIGVVGSNEDANVEGIVMVTVGMTLIELVPILFCFNWIRLSNSFSVSLN